MTIEEAYRRKVLAEYTIMRVLKELREDTGCKIKYVEYVYTKDSTVNDVGMETILNENDEVKITLSV